VDGRMPKRAKGQKADWSPEGRTAFLMPGGIAEHIVRSRVPRYRDIYDAAKARLIETRTGECGESEEVVGPQDGAEAGAPPEVEVFRGLRPIQVDKIARTIAAKAFAGDLLAAMKQAAGTRNEIGRLLGSTDNPAVAEREAEIDLGYGGGGNNTEEAS